MTRENPNGRHISLDSEPQFTNNLKQATGLHFNTPGHSLDNMKFIIIEKSKETNENYRKEREKFFIQKFNTFKNGLNRMP